MPRWRARRCTHRATGLPSLRAAGHGRCGHGTRKGLAARLPRLLARRSGVCRGRRGLPRLSGRYWVATGRGWLSRRRPGRWTGSRYIGAGPSGRLADRTGSARRRFHGRGVTQGGSGPRRGPRDIRGRGRRGGRSPASAGLGDGFVQRRDMRCSPVRRIDNRCASRRSGPRRRHVARSGPCRRHVTRSRHASSRCARSRDDG